VERGFLNRGLKIETLDTLIHYSKAWTTLGEHRLSRSSLPHGESGVAIVADDLSELPFFVAGDSVQGREIKRFDWGSTPLGHPSIWSPNLRAMVQLLLASKQPMFVAWGPERTFIYNDGYIPIMGSKHPAQLGKPSAMVWSEAWPLLGPLFDRVFEGEPIHQTGFLVPIDRHGIVEDAYFNFSYTPMAAPDGTVEGLFGVCTETTTSVALNRQQLDTALKERDLIFDLSPDLIGVGTFDGMLKSINPAWASRLKRTNEFLLSHPFADIIHPEDLAETGAVVADLIAGNPVHQFHVRLLTEAGEAIPYAWSAVPGVEPGTFYTTGRDISADIENAESLRQAQEALRQAQKMEAVGQLTGGIAHDFNNIIAGVSGSLELMTTRLAQGRISEVERYLTAAAGATRRAASLTQRLLAFSRRQTLDPKPISLNGLIDGMLELINRSVGPGIAVETVGRAGIWDTFADPGQLESALLNLCINARDAMPEGGKITIETANRWMDDRAAKERGLSPGQYVSLCVSDTGTGMTKDVIERAFDPFFTTKPIGQGTGLGLSMIHGFAGQSGGTVRIYSEVGEGTMVCIYLPRHIGDTEAQEDVEGEPIETRAVLGGPTVMLVDDEPLIRMVTAEHLSDLGYTVIEAGDAHEALRLLDGQPIALLITDVGLPGGMNGRQLAEAVREHRPELEVLFITGYAENAVFNHGHLERGMHMMNKPFQMDAFAEKVAGLISDT
jgi:signal transduction histidine kinase/CheY-like chemotaxis protein